MLVHLSVHNYAIVEHLDLELQRGMSVISGETGAGKSIMLDALGLALGDRADSSAVRIGADKADILASFDLDDIPDARAWLAERDIPVEAADYDAEGVRLTVGWPRDVEVELSPLASRLRGHLELLEA